MRKLDKYEAKVCFKLYRQGCFVAMMIDCLIPTPFGCEVISGEVHCTWTPCA